MAAGHGAQVRGFLRGKRTDPPHSARHGRLACTAAGRPLFFWALKTLAPWSPARPPFPAPATLPRAHGGADTPHGTCAEGSQAANPPPPVRQRKAQHLCAVPSARGAPGCPHARRPPTPPAQTPPVRARLHGCLQAYKPLEIFHMTHS